VPKSRLELVVSKLQKFYGKLSAPPSDAFTLFVWEILSNHSTLQKRDAAINALKRIGALTPDGMRHAGQKALEESVARAGPYRDQRLLGLRKGVDVFHRDNALVPAISGPLPAAQRRLKALPKMGGDSGAYRMLLFAGGHAVLPIDARVARVATRLGCGEHNASFPATARSVREAAARELPQSVAAYRDAYTYIAHHGAVTCTEADPRCHACPLLKECPYGQRAAATKPTINAEPRRVRNLR
jgi:endonuclease III